MVEVSAVTPRLAFFADRESAWAQAYARNLHVFRCEVDTDGALFPGSIWLAVSNPDSAVRGSVMFLSCLHELLCAVKSSLSKGGALCV